MLANKYLCLGDRRILQLVNRIISLNFDALSYFFYSDLENITLLSCFYILMHMPWTSNAMYTFPIIIIKW